MTTIRLAATAVAALAATACATTSDPVECANQGIGGYVSGCPDTVAKDIEDRKRALERMQKENAGLQAHVDEQLKIEGALQAEVESLKKQISTQSAAIADVRRQVQSRRNQNAITQAAYDSAMKELAAGEQRLRSLRSIHATRDQVREDSAIVAEVARSTARVREVNIG